MRVEALRQIDRYQLLEEIGSGGMAVVYKGLDTALDREVAVKVMHPHLANKADSRRRFSREARAVARLRHPYILEIFDFSGDEAKESYIVTEYVRGQTLRAFGDANGFGLPEIAAMAIEQLCEALQAAHEAGIVHRDLKPENVMVRDDGVLKLMDFGIARVLDKDEKMTMTGALVGSPLHMAPEVIEGKEADVRADIFAVGTIFFWMITGEMAFQGGSTHDTLRRILEGSFTDVRMLQPTCSDEIAEIIGRCLQGDPADRFQDVASLRAALRPVLSEAGVENVEAELRSFFAEPHAYRALLQDRLVGRLLAGGEKAMAEKRSAKALSLFNRVLALEPENAAVAAHLASMSRAKRRARLLRQAGLALGALAGAVALSFGLRAAWIAVKPQFQEPVQVDRLPPPVNTRPPVVVPVKPAAEPPRRSPPRPAPALARAEPAKETSTEPAEVASISPTAPDYTVTLSWYPPAAYVTLDGVRIDNSAPSWTGPVKGVRTHRIRVKGDCCEAWEGSLVATDRGLEVKRDGTGEQAVPLPGRGPFERRIKLSPGYATIRAQVDLDTAYVYVGDEYRGLAKSLRDGLQIAFDRDVYRKTVLLTFRPSSARTPFRERQVAVRVEAGKLEDLGEIRLLGAPP